MIDRLSVGTRNCWFLHTRSRLKYREAKGGCIWSTSAQVGKQIGDLDPAGFLRFQGRCVQDRARQAGTSGAVGQAFRECGGQHPTTVPQYLELGTLAQAEGKRGVISSESVDGEDEQERRGSGRSALYEQTC